MESFSQLRKGSQSRPQIVCYFELFVQVHKSYTGVVQLHKCEHALVQCVFAYLCKCIATRHRSKLKQLCKSTHFHVHLSNCTNAVQWFEIMESINVLLSEIERPEL